MKNKRLKHHAFTFCHMFCGHQLLHDYKALTELHKGEIIIDILSGDCFHDSRKIKPLNMADVLKSWMMDDLNANNIPLSSIEKAKLFVNFKTERHRGQRDKTTVWTRPTKDFISCNLDCTGIIATNEKEYTEKYSEFEEWPTNYGGMII
jgi:hypothetical protein